MNLKPTYKFFLVLLIIVMFFHASALALELVRRPTPPRPSPPASPPGQPETVTNIVADGSSACGGPTSKCEWAWNDVIGWIDFRPTESPAPTDGSVIVGVGNTEILGYASSSVGYISLNCATQVPGGPVPTCTGGAGLWKVSVNSTNGALAGWAWNDQIGWISFSGTPNYGVSITISEGGNHCSSPTPPATCGDFNGWAWNDVIGWISFNCANSGTNGCSVPAIQYKVKTSWVPPPPTLPEGDLTSSIFDTQAVNGAAINTIIWRGTPPAGAPGNSGDYVKFKIATSDSQSGPWNFIGPDALDPESYYQNTLGPDHPININLAPGHHNNKRYVRYKVFLFPCNPVDGCNPAQGPRIDDIIINWSP